ncbi:unnamed protein product [Cylicocyclus nassatus]|uniref:Uncharacterized protein n=1 Tax=Cylicocyclus nassatus TaxID=53992 RepID=A0AA36DL44_CYLNA|nr:unnamed protein product [Cylicocyclus nassatus]
MVVLNCAIDASDDIRNITLAVTAVICMAIIWLELIMPLFNLSRDVYKGELKVSNFTIGSIRRALSRRRRRKRK